MISSTIKRLNDRRDSAEGTGEDAGFTLIELMVVLLILAILLAIAIPTFLGVTKSANDRAAQSNLNTALVNAKSIFQQNSQSYLLPTTGTGTPVAAMSASLASAEPNLSFAIAAVTSGATNATVSVAVDTTGNGIALAESAKGTGNCWYVIDNSGASTWAASNTATTSVGTWYGESKGASTCSAAAVPAAGTGISFQQSSFPNL
jgi:type IV pilus assembly protein PilA